MAMRERTVYEESVPKQDVFRFQVDEEDRARLARLASHYNLTPSAVVRMLVKRDDDAVSASKPVPRAPDSATKARKKKT